MDKKTEKAIKQYEKEIQKAMKQKDFVKAIYYDILIKSLEEKNVA